MRRGKRRSFNRGFKFRRGRVSGGIVLRVEESGFDLYFPLQGKNEGVRTYS